MGVPDRWRKFSAWVERDRVRSTRGTCCCKEAFLLGRDFSLAQITGKVSSGQSERAMSKGGILIIVALLCATAVAASAGNPVWSISVFGLKGEPLGDLTLELADESADTCVSGAWKKARLLQSSFQSLAKLFETKDYFPTYESDGEVLTIQLNSPRMCDAYLLLTGKFSTRDGSGDYTSTGLGGGELRGTFTAKKQ